LIILLGLLTFLLASRENIETTILRAPSILYQQLDSTHYQNLYLIKTINKTYGDVKLELQVVKPEGAVIKIVGNHIHVKPESKYDGQFFLIVPDSQMTGHKTKVVVDVYLDGKKIERVKTNFLGPIYK
jgi:hypothetical protein